MASENTLKLRTIEAPMRYIVRMSSARRKASKSEIRKKLSEEKPAPKRPKRVPHRPIPTNPLTGLLSAELAPVIDWAIPPRQRTLKAERIARNKRKAERRRRAGKA